jgi:DNA-binding CsgD family transcriptional regulator
MKSTLRLTLLCSFILLLCTCGRAQSQSEVDSLQADLEARPLGDTARLWTLHHLCRAAQWVDLPLAKQYAHQSLRESEALDYDSGRSSAYKLLGSTSDYLEQLDSALYYYAKATVIHEANDQGYLQGIVYFNTANVHYKRGQTDSAKHFLQLADARFAAPELLSQRSGVKEFTAQLSRENGEYENAIIDATKAYELALQADDKARIITTQMEVAYSYIALGQYEEALAYNQRGLQTAEAEGIGYYVASLHLSIAEVLRELKQIDKAFTYAKRGLDLVAANPAFVDMESNGRSILGGIYLDTERFEAAEAELAQAEKLLRGPGFTNKRGEVLGHLAEAQLMQRKYTLAKKNAREAIAVTRSTGQRPLTAQNYDRLSRIAEETNDFRSAYRYLQQSKATQDSLNLENLTEKVAELTLLFEKERQDRIISEQASALALLESQARADRLQKTGLVAGLIGLIALLIAGWYAYLQRNRRQELEKAHLADEVKAQRKELSTHALQMAQKGQLLDQFGEELRQIKGEHPNDRKKLDSMLRELNSEERIDQDWNNFRTYFQGVHGDFEDRLKATAEVKLSPRELRLSALIKMQLTNQEIGAILGVSQESLYKAKYRLRKKFPQAKEGELDSFLVEF